MTVQFSQPLHCFSCLLDLPTAGWACTQSLLVPPMDLHDIQHIFHNMPSGLLSSLNPSLLVSPSTSPTQSHWPRVFFWSGTPLCFPYLTDSCLSFRSWFDYNLQAGICALFFLFLWENPELFPIFALSGVVLKGEYTCPCVSLALSEGPWGQNYFHNKTKMLFRFFIVLTFAQTVQKPWWVKLLALALNDLEAVSYTHLTLADE